VLGLRVIAYPELELQALEKHELKWAAIPTLSNVEGKQHLEPVTRLSFLYEPISSPLFSIRAYKLLFVRATRANLLCYYSLLSVLCCSFSTDRARKALLSGGCVGAVLTQPDLLYIISLSSRVVR